MRVFVCRTAKLMQGLAVQPCRKRFRGRCQPVAKGDRIVSRAWMDVWLCRCWWWLTADTYSWMEFAFDVSGTKSCDVTGKARGCGMSRACGRTTRRVYRVLRVSHLLISHHLPIHHSSRSYPSTLLSALSTLLPCGHHHALHPVQKSAGMHTSSHSCTSPSQRPCQPHRTLLDTRQG